MSGRGPADHHILGDNTSTATHVLLCALIFVLATPSFNPMVRAHVLEYSSERRAIDTRYRSVGLRQFVCS